METIVKYPYIYISFFLFLFQEMKNEISLTREVGEIILFIELFFFFVFHKEFLECERDS